MLPLYGAPLEGSKSEVPVQIFLRRDSGTTCARLRAFAGYAFKGGNVLFDATVERKSFLRRKVLDSSHLLKFTLFTHRLLSTSYLNGIFSTSYTGITGRDFSSWKCCAFVKTITGFDESSYERSELIKTFDSSGFYICRYMLLYSLVTEMCNSAW